MSGPDWATVNPQLVDILGSLASPDEGTVPGQNWSAEWKDRKVSAVASSGILKGVKLYLKITSVVGIGDDDNRLEQETPDGDLQETIYGLRRVTLNLQTTCTEVSDASWALSILERIRTRLRRQRTIDALLDLNVGIVRIMQAIDLSKTQDQKVQSRASMDVILTLVSCDTDPVTTGWISSVEITNELHDVDGTVLPPPPDTTTIITTP